MSATWKEIAEVMETLPEPPSGMLPVIFAGENGIRCIGYAPSLRTADTLGIAAHCHMRYVSKAVIGDWTMFLLHGKP